MKNVSIDEDRRKKYWDEEYYEYWKKRVEEANDPSIESSEVVEKDAKVPEDEIYDWLINHSEIGNGKILEVGCGWGRLFEIYSKHNLLIYAIDISRKMVEEANRNKKDRVVEVKEAEAENIPYGNNTFDYVACFATFDATYQDRALSEMIRVLKINGKLLLTGKNKRYCEDDELAMEAEKGARRKGHPNFFTDVNDLKAQLIEKGHKIILEYYFVRRGDFTKLVFSEKMPSRFYEYFFVIQKLSDDYIFNKFHYTYSDVRRGRE